MLLLITACGENADPLDFQPSSCEEAVANTPLIENAPPFDQWRQSNTQRDPDGDLIFEKDIVVSEDQLIALYLQRYGVEQPLSTSGFRSLVNCRDDGLDNVWSVANKIDITYCFGTFTTSGLRDNVEGMMRRSTMDWERAGDVNFIHVPMPAEECDCIFAKDVESNPECEDNTDRARLRVREADLSVGHPARAGFPGNTVLELKVDKAADNTNEKLYRLITHELGHVLGFMHEHLRYDNSNTLSDCSLGSKWRTVTDPDSHSIMGYGHCGGIDGATSPDVISPLDRLGAAFV